MAEVASAAAVPLLDVHGVTLQYWIETRTVRKWGMQS